MAKKKSRTTRGTAETPRKTKAAKKKPRRSLPKTIRTGWHILNAAVSGDGSRIAMAAAVNDFGVWQIDTGKPVLGPITMSGRVQLPVLAINEDGRYFCVTTTSNETFVYNVDKGTETRLLKRLSSSFAFVPHGGGLAAVDGRAVSVFELESWERRVKLEGHTAPIQKVVVSPDGKLLVSLAGKQAKLWNLKSGKLIADLAGHERIVHIAAFAPDNAFIATCSEDTTVRLWSKTGKSRGILEGHDDLIFHVCVSPDGRTIASADYSNTVHLWDVASQSSRASLQADELSMAFNSTGSKLTLCHFEKPAQRVDVSNGKLLESLPNAQLAELVPDKQCMALAVGEELQFVESD